MGIFIKHKSSSLIPYLKILQWHPIVPKIKPKSLKILLSLYTATKILHATIKTQCSQINK